LFMTHGGVFGTQEALYHGVPMLMIPFYGDQFRNSIRSVLAGYATMLQFSEVTRQNLTDKLNVILNDQQYTVKSKEKSALFRDNLVNPMDEAMYYIEYAAKHKGTPHLRSSAVDLSWPVYLHLDILGFLFIFIFAFIKIRIETHKRRKHYWEAEGVFFTTTE